MHPKDAIFSVEKISCRSDAQEEDFFASSEPFSNNQRTPKKKEEEEESLFLEARAQEKQLIQTPSLADISDSNFFEFSSNDISDEFYAQDLF